MNHYIVHRLAISVPVLLGITMLVFFFISAAPGDPLVAMMDPEAGVSYEHLQASRQALGLDKPIPVRYLIWFRELTRGNLGYSYVTGRPVAREIGDRLLPTLELMGAALIFSITVGVSLGLVAALRQYSLVDYALTAFSFTWVSIPNFFFAYVLIYVFALQLDLLPTSGMMTAGSQFILSDNIRHLILPLAVLGLERIAVFARYTRSSLLEVLGQDYLTTARAKGLRERAVILGHAFRNALLPVITIVGLSMPLLFGGALLVETVFQWPGMGLLYITAVMGRDYPLIMGLDLFAAIIVLLSNLLADIAYAVADPRIRYR